LALELPTTHRVPITWLRENASAAIRWRTVRDILPPGGAAEADRLALQNEVLASRAVAQCLKKQKASGLWGDNILGLAPSKSLGIKDIGTIVQYRHLLELGVGSDQRAFRLADRVLFRLLSRDEDPELAFEYRKQAKADPEFAAWIRGVMREATTAALAQSGQIEDPRVRGAAHRIATDVSAFLRSELVDKPLVRKGSRTVLHPDARPPSLFSVAAVAYMPAVQRERAGYVERLGAFLAKPASKRTFVIVAGKRAVKPLWHLLGDPLQADSSGHPKDLPFALYWIELLVRMSALHIAPTAQRILGRLLADCDERGIWNPKNLRGIPTSSSHLADFAFPLDPDPKSVESRKADVTFRLALIAKLAGWQLEFN
jgi:hypothetical protein